MSSPLFFRKYYVQKECARVPGMIVNVQVDYVRPRLTDSIVKQLISSLSTVWYRKMIKISCIYKSEPNYRLTNS